MYKSLIDGHECTEHHYLVELVISRKAKKHGLVLPDKFWSYDEWKKEYKLQVIAARSLLKIFDTQDILDGLRSKEGCWIYSLKFPGLVDIISNEKKRKEKKIPNQPEKPQHAASPVSKTDAKPVIQKRKNILDTLEGIDANVQRNSF